MVIEPWSSIAGIVFGLALVLWRKSFVRHNEAFQRTLFPQMKSYDSGTSRSLEILAVAVGIAIALAAARSLLAA